MVDLPVVRFTGSGHSWPQFQHGEKTIRQTNIGIIVLLLARPYRNNEQVEPTLSTNLKRQPNALFMKPAVLATHTQ